MILFLAWKFERSLLCRITCPRCALCAMCANATRQSGGPRFQPRWRATLRRGRALCCGWRATLCRGRLPSAGGRDGARPSIWLQRLHHFGCGRRQRYGFAASNSSVRPNNMSFCLLRCYPHAARVSADSRIASQARQTDSTSIASMYLLEARRRCRVLPGQTAFCTTRCCEP